MPVKPLMEERVMEVKGKGFLSTLQIADQYFNQNPTPVKEKPETELSFQEILCRRNSEEDIRFSKHAAQRLNSRNIELTDGQVERLKQGTARAQQKGIRESLVLVDQLAFIVNVPNNTVVTAMNQQDAAENVFTNIDGAVIV